jgi:hypothetical protein
MIPIKTYELFIDKDARILMSLSKYKKLIRGEMQKNGNTTIPYCKFFKTCSYLKISEIKNGIIQN